MGDTTREAVVAALRAIRCDAACTEEALHAQAARALEDAGIAAQHEARLAPRCRIDFLAGTIGIEIKKSRPRSGALLIQLRRYAACEQVTELVVQRLELHSHRPRRGLYYERNVHFLLDFLVDLDEVGVTNLNRQAEALWSTLGQPKAQAMARRVLDEQREITGHQESVFCILT